MAVRTFPEGIPPSSRSYKPGKLPETVFESQNGSISFVSYGQNFVNAELTLNFANINDDKAALILQHYASVVGDDYVAFGATQGLQGMGSELIQNGIQTGNELLKWRYSDAPQVQSVYPGVSSVQVQFVGVLYGA